MIPTRICVFCNERPIKKTKEHVLPEWLIELTGGSNRPLWKYTVNKIEKSLPSFDSFVFPACDACNQSYSRLEAQAKSVVDDILNDRKLSAREVEILLDWMDKIRIGCWLGDLMLDNKSPTIKPLFGIATRIKSDRLLWIQKSVFTNKRLTFFGYKDPLFYFLPSFFGMYVNDVEFISASNGILLNGKTILPRIEVQKIISPRAIICNYNYESNIKPKIGIPYLGRNSTTFAQVFYPGPLKKDKLNDDQLNLMDSNMQNSKILIYRKRGFDLYPETKSDRWKRTIYIQDADLRKRFVGDYERIREWTAKQWPVDEKMKKITESLIKIKGIP